MSYKLYLYARSALPLVEQGLSLDEINFPLIPIQTVDKFVTRLLKYGYTVDVENEQYTTYVHDNPCWGITASVFDTAIVFSVPYWTDSQNAIFEALMTASELCDTGTLILYNPQDDSWFIEPLE